MSSMRMLQRGESLYPSTTLQNSTLDDPEVMDGGSQVPLTGFAVMCSFSGDGQVNIICSSLSGPSRAQPPIQTVVEIQEPRPRRSLSEKSISRILEQRGACSYESPTLICRWFEFWLRKLNCQH